ncbi:hypothetical protein [Fictibacillus norfolkensis]|uniref:Polysaccharide chain length determinant N-terminal domain-containing protein n=1 Tax=Fictibacillus norfolkensis TaxID=2762233 RepID=A0ABR8SI55_9BACL|nr:hypothetical protein [Fictibacillus norfolkensis]MBD7963158.1 hypothetical protein [Fictibacillus norfolkensis]
MKETLNRIWIRFKKLSILLILIPFLAAGAAYLFQKEGPSSYTANADIQLAKLGKDVSELKYIDFTDAENAKVYLTKDVFLEDLEKKFPDINIQSVKSKLSFVIKPAKIMNINYTADSPEEAEETLKFIVNNYINESVKTTDELAEKLEESKSEDSQKEKTPSEYDIIIDGLEPVTEVVGVQLDQPQESTKNTAVFGFLIGLILSSMILLLPEVFRK